MRLNPIHGAMAGVAALAAAAVPVLTLTGGAVGGAAVASRPTPAASHPAAPVAGPSASSASSGGAGGAGLTIQPSGTGSSSVAAYSTYLSASPSPALLFDNWNGYGVVGQPPAPTTISFSTTTHLTSIADYHWNNGSGALPGRISLVDGSGRFVASGQAQGSSTSADWVAPLSVDVAPGTYTVVDSDWNSWSQNQQSGSRGFTRLWGYAVSSPAPTPTPTPTPTTRPTPPPPPASPWRGCGYSVSVAALNTCSATVGSTVTLHLWRDIQAPIGVLVLTQADNPSLRPTNNVLVSVSGSATRAGSNDTFIVPRQVCFAGRYSKWHVRPVTTTGQSLGNIADLNVTCP